MFFGGYRMITPRRMAIAILALGQPGMAAMAAAETMPKFYVYGEEDTVPALKACSVSHAAGITAVKAELRRAQLGIEENSKSPETVMDAYVNINAMQIKSEPQICAYSIGLNFETFDELANPFAGGKEVAKISYCSKGSLMVWPKQTAQAEIDNSLRTYVRDCLDLYRKRKSS